MLGEAAIKRASGWRCLAQGFCEPTPELLSDSYLATLDEAISWLDYGQEQFEASREAIADFLRSGGGQGSAVLLQDMKAEYGRLFLGPDPLVAPPYESMYRNQDSPQVPGPSTEAVRSFYQGSGLQLAPSHSDLPDHVATECDFMHRLCQTEANAWQRGDDKRAKEYRMQEHHFLDKHLAFWLPALCHRIQSDTRCKFYWGLADFAHHYLSVETGSEGISLPPL